MSNKNKDLCLIAAAVFWIALYPFVFSDLWAWFVVPIFGLPELSYFSALGLMLFFNTAQKRIVSAAFISDYSEDIFKKTITHKIIYPCTAWWCGFVIQSFL